MFRRSPWRRAELMDKTLHGTYIGINPLLADRGASLEECKCVFFMDENGISVHKTISGKVFKIHYNSSWVFHLKNWGVDECLAVRQHPESNLAEFIIGFPSPRNKDAKCDAVMLLGEGMPAVLGIFTREAVGTSVETFLKTKYAESYQPKTKEEKQSWLTPVDIESAKATMQSAFSHAKIEILKRASHNLWTGTEDEIRSRLELIKLGINDADPKVQIQALDTFVLGGRVTSGVDIVTKLLKQEQRIAWGVAGKALDATICLLYEAHTANKNIADLKIKLGTADVEKLHEKTKGALSPEQYKLLEKVIDQSNVNHERRWTPEHQKTLRDAISVFLSHPDYEYWIIANEVQKAKRALKDYLLPETEV